MDSPVTLISIARESAGLVFLFDFGRYMMAASLVAGVVWLMRCTRFASRKIQKREASRADFLREFTSSVRTVIVYVAIAIPVIWAFRNGWLRSYLGEVGPLVFTGYLAAILVAHDSYFYWTHRAMHTRFLYKHVHRFHHRSTIPTAWAAYAFSAPEAVAMTIFMPLYAAVVPTPEPVLFTFLAVMIIRNAMGHAGFELHPRWWLSTPLTRWFTTTTHHDLHHAGGFNHNYGLYFTWWDKMMGTEHPDYATTFHRVTAPADTATAKANVAIEGAAG